ncbi:hypothetical protein PUMCH_001475 [Australozyma saopauloensis]|uniref:DNA-(apurinic or apyrimidinic site) lyase n=1 Tax=Australozyma saopauloensis TaxID=291208 RepID=A0AAX4H940_9ASCO|nr:hypothetical protein PUMCH_001475 [[Candida] saopauloensis]
MTVDIVWRTLPLSIKEVSLARVLRCGQTFRWKNMNNVWRFTTKDKIVLLRQDDTKIEYGCGGVINDQSGTLASSDAVLDAVLAFVTDYFNLAVKLEELYEEWGAVEKKYVKNSEMASFSFFPGIRMLRQDPWETVVLFICLSNNNVKRISKMCDSLCDEFGDFVCDFEGMPYHNFPGPEKLCDPSVEGRLRELGFGYRAKYIQQTAAMFMSPEYPDITLESLAALREESYDTAHEYLLQLVGVGPKVADCICLMALDKHDVVPVDTHVLQIAVRDYKFKKPKIMNAKSYHEVRVHLQNLFGEYAGWAQLVMFAADLVDLNNGVNQVDGAKIKHEVAVSEESEVQVSKSGKRTIVAKQTVKRIKVEA